VKDVSKNKNIYKYFTHNIIINAGFCFYKLKIKFSSKFANTKKMCSITDDVLYLGSLRAEGSYRLW
jgi:hypothetical protein